MSELVVVFAAVGLRFLVFEMWAVLPQATICWFVKKLCRCPFCQGFWMGGVLALIIYHSISMAAILGLATAAVSYYLTNFEGKDGDG